MLKRGDRVRLVLPRTSRVHMWSGEIVTVVNAVDNSLNEYRCPVVIKTDDGTVFAVKESEVEDGPE